MHSYNITHCIKRGVKREVHQVQRKLECGLMPNVMAAMPNIGGTLYSTPQSLADAHYWRACSNAANTQNVLKLAGMAQTTGPISDASGQTFTIL